MQSSHPARILVVANRTASTPRLLEEVGRRAQAGPCTLRPAHPRRLQPQGGGLDDGGRDPAPGGRGGGQGGRAHRRPGPLAAVERAIHDGHFDEVIVSTLPAKRSWWLRRDLVRRIEGLGLPVTAVVPRQKSIIDDSEETLRARVGGDQGRRRARCGLADGTPARDRGQRADPGDTQQMAAGTTR